MACWRNGDLGQSERRSAAVKAVQVALLRAVSFFESSSRAASALQRDATAGTRDGGGKDRAGQRTSSNLIDSGDPATGGALQ